MPRLAANITLLFTEYPFLDRFAAAADHGFTGVEILVPYEFSADDVAARLAAHNLEGVLINTPYGPTAGGHTGLGALPGREAEFAADARRLAGVPEHGADPAQCRAVFVDNLRAMANQAADAGITVLIEPLNTGDFRGYFLTRQDQAHAIIADVGMANLKVQMDFYHCQIMEGFVSDKARRFIDGIGYFQISGVPGRVEPDVGELNHTYLLDLVDELGFDGWVGAEYNPRAGTAAGLGWATPYGITV
jgi:hydroxypyruvate isomerase